MKTTRPYLQFGTAPQGVTLDAGESEASAMALEWPADLLIMDESSGRAMARNLNIRITGTLGLLLKARRDGEIPSLKVEMDRLVQECRFLRLGPCPKCVSSRGGGGPMKTIISIRPTTC